MRNLEPLLKGCLAAIAKSAFRFKRGQRKCLIASEVKPCWPGTKPQETKIYALNTGTS